jgi:hypothetical protein
VGYVKAAQNHAGWALALRLAVAMTHYVRFSVHHAACAAVLAGLCVGVFAMSTFGTRMFAAGAGGSLKTTDDWRRTAHGWERVSGWPHVARNPAITGLAASLPPVAKRSIHGTNPSDAHPAALALAQLVGSMLSLAGFSPRGRSFLRETSFAMLLRRSFRASVFGS